MGLYDRDYMREKNDDEYLKGDYGYAVAPASGSADDAVDYRGESTQYRVVGTRSMYVVNTIVAAAGVLLIGLLVAVAVPWSWGAEPAKDRLAIGDWSMDVGWSTSQRIQIERRVAADSKRELYQLLQESMFLWIRKLHTEMSRPDRIDSLGGWQVELLLQSDRLFYLDEISPRGDRNTVRGTWSTLPDNEQILVFESDHRVNYARLNVDRLIFLTAPSDQGIPLFTVKKPVGWRW